MNAAVNYVVLTGAGISAESGLQTFRTPDESGRSLWADHDVEDVATPAGYRRNPSLVHDFYRARRADVAAAEPNAAHLALGQLSDALSSSLTVVTQNVDDLHERGGVHPDSLIHMHGQLATALCPACGEREDAGEYGTTCAVCGIGILRPDIVFFHELPHHTGRIERAVQNADVFVAIGTSGNVYPAAGYVDMAHLYGVDTIELNIEPSGRFGHHVVGPATETVPMLVRTILGNL